MTAKRTRKKNSERHRHHAHRWLVGADWNTVWKEDDAVQAYAAAFGGFKVQTRERPTRFSGNREIDYFLARAEHSRFRYKILPDAFSDHRLLRLAA